MMDVKRMLFVLKKIGHTESAIAKAIHVNQSTISRIISGKIQDPKGSLVNGIKHLFETEIKKGELRMLLQECELQIVSGGIAANKVVEAILVGTQIYEGAAVAFDQSESSILLSTQVYANFGRELGEQIFNIAHPNPLGKMIYYPSDF